MQLNEVVMRVSAKKVKPGDIFSLHLGNGAFGFARLIYVMEGRYYLTEFFDITARDPEFKPEVLRAGRVIPLQNLDYTMLLSKKFYRWKLLLRDPGFQPDWAELRQLKFRGGPGEIEMINFDWTPGSSDMRIAIERTSREESDKFERWDTCWNPQRIYPRLRKAFDLEPNHWRSQADLMRWMYHNDIFFTPPESEDDQNPAYGDWREPPEKKPDES